MGQDLNQVKKTNFTIGVIVAIIILLIVVGIGYLIYNQVAEDDPKAEQAVKQAVEEQAGVDIEQLAKKLNQANAVLYGSETCGYCTQQKEAFGDYIGQIAYVDYAKSPEVFEEKGIQNFPTWIINGKKYVGFHTLEELWEIVK